MPCLYTCFQAALKFVATALTISFTKELTSRGDLCPVNSVVASSGAGIFVDLGNWEKSSSFVIKLPVQNRWGERLPEHT